MKSTDVIISGGGIPGLTLGILLAEAGLSVAICDPSPLLSVNDIKPSGRTVALMESSLSVLAQAGLHAKVEGKSADLKTLAIVDDEFRAEFHSSEIGQSRFGQNIQNSLLQAYAADKFRSLKNVRLIQDKLCGFDVHDNGVSVRLSNNEHLSAKLLIGADGCNSFVRKKSKIEVWEHDYDQIAMTGIIEHTKSHKNASTEFHFSGGPFTIVPMQGNKCSFVWMEKTSDANKILSYSKSQIEKIMQDRTKGLVGEISLIGSLESFPIKIQKSNELISSRVALIAEAAHVLSPIGAQGMNLSLRDVASLFDAILEAARLGLDIGAPSILKKYADDRYLDIQLRIAGTDALNRSVAAGNSFVRSLKNMGLKAARNIPPLRSILVHEALAPQVSFTQAMLSDLDTRATVKTSTRTAPAA